FPVWLATWSAIGLLFTTAVSWLLAAFLPQRSWNRRDKLEPSHFDSRGSFTVTEYRAIGSVRRTWERHVPGDDGFPSFFDAIGQSSFVSFSGGYCPDAAWRAWGRLDEVFKNRDRFDY